MLAAAYFRRTGDLEFLRADLRPTSALALGWIDRYGDVDDDGFVEYARQTPIGLVQQGWKDSHDSVFHDDGTLAEGADRAVRGAGLRVRGVAVRRPRSRSRWAGRRRPRTTRARAVAMRTRFAEQLLGRGARHLRAGAGRRQAAVPGARPPTPATRCGRGSRTRRARAAWRETLMSDEGVLRLGRAHAGDDAGALQPDVVSQRLGVAARQRDHRARAARATGFATRSSGCSRACARPACSSTCTACPS